MDGSDRAPTPDAAARERLPNLFEVLSRRTLAPVRKQRTSERHWDSSIDGSRSIYSHSTFTCAMCSDPWTTSISGEWKQTSMEGEKKEA